MTGIRATECKAGRGEQTVDLSASGSTPTESGVTQSDSGVVRTFQGGGERLQGSARQPTAG